MVTTVLKKHEKGTRREKESVIAVEKESSAGKATKDDIFVLAKPLPKDGGVGISLSSKVLKLYGDRITETIEQKLNDLGVKDVQVTVDDYGALDYVIKARVETAIRRMRK